MASIVVNSIYKRFGALEVIREFSIAVNGGEIVCLLGPSGCGKSTLLKIMAHLIPADSGTVMKWGTVGMVFQEPRLLYWRTVRENLEIPYLLCGKPVDRERIQQLLDMVGLGEFGAFYPGMLSIGMQQRVAIVRAVLLDPDIILMDEPFRGLDVRVRECLEDDILLLCQNAKSVLLVTHSIEEAVRLADRVAIVSSSPMCLLETIQMPNGPKPRDIYAPAYLGIKKRIHAYLSQMPEQMPVQSADQPVCEASPRLWDEGLYASIPRDGSAARLRSDANPRSEV